MHKCVHLCFVPSPNGLAVVLVPPSSLGSPLPIFPPLLPGIALTAGHAPCCTQHLAQAHAHRHFKEGPCLTAKGDLGCSNLLSASHRLRDLEKFLDFLWILECFFVAILLKKKKTRKLDTINLKVHVRTSLAAQWLRLRLPVQEVWVWSLIGEPRKRKCLSMRIHHDRVWHYGQAFQMGCLIVSLSL